MDVKETHLFVQHLGQVHSTWTEFIYKQKIKYIYIYILEKGLNQKKNFRYYWNVPWKSKVKIRQFTPLVTCFTTTTYIPLTSLIGPHYRLWSSIEITIFLYLHAILNILGKGWKRYISKKKSVGTSYGLLLPPSLLFLNSYKYTAFPYDTASYSLFISK